LSEFPFPFGMVLQRDVALFFLARVVMGFPEEGHPKRGVGATPGAGV
jgi:hypothetical protein